MIRRIVAAFVVLAFAGSLALVVGCDGEKPVTPPPTTPKPDEKKPGSSTPATPSPVASAIDTAKQQLKCGKAGCQQPGLPGKQLAHAGKTVNFCCDNCMGDYKKANNIQ